MAKKLMLGDQVDYIVSLLRSSYLDTIIIYHIGNSEHKVKVYQRRCVRYGPFVCNGASKTRDDS